MWGGISLRSQGGQEHPSSAIRMLVRPLQHLWTGRTLTSACGCQLAGAEDKEQLCLSQNQLSFAKGRFRLTCEGSSLGAAFACAF